MWSAYRIGFLSHGVYQRYPQSHPQPLMHQVRCKREAFRAPFGRVQWNEPQLHRNFAKATVAMRRRPILPARSRKGRIRTRSTGSTTCRKANSQNPTVDARARLPHDAAAPAASRMTARRSLRSFKGRIEHDATAVRRSGGAVTRQRPFSFVPAPHLRIHS
jgi:hypothetical protein